MSLGGRPKRTERVKHYETCGNCHFIVLPGTTHKPLAVGRCTQIDELSKDGPR